MAPLNRAGHGARPVLPGRPVTAEDVMDAVLSGSWVVDLRTREAFSRRHLPGSIGIEHGAQMATYVGWLVPAEDDLVLLTDDPTELTTAIAQLADLGIEGVGTHLLADEAGLTASYRRATWDDVRQRLATGDAPLLVDVRQRSEWEADHLPGAVHLPIQDVPQGGPLLPPGELWVHCRSGYRAGIAASVLQRQGRSVVHVDDDWARVGQLRLPTVRAAA
jgi:rhodanese-related sulfurtransferase